MISLSFDPKCLDLAEVFLSDEGARRKGDADELAQCIQNTIESWLEDERIRGEPRPDPLLDYVMFGTQPK